MSKTKEIPIPDKISGFSQVRIDVDLTDSRVKFYGMNALRELIP